MGWECSNCFAISLGSIACKSSCKGHNCLEEPSAGKFLYGESPGQERKPHSVVARREESDWPELNVLGLLTSLAVFICIYTMHFLSKVSLELQLSAGARNTFQARGCRLLSVSIESTTDNIIQVSVYILLLSCTSLFIRKHNPRKRMGVGDIFLSHIHPSTTSNPLMGSYSELDGFAFELTAGMPKDLLDIQVI